MGSNNDFFANQIRVLKWGGIWIPEKDKNLFERAFYYVYDFICIFYTVFLFTILEFVILHRSFDDLSVLMKSLNMAVTHLLTAVKVFMWFYHRGDLLLIIKTLSQNVVAFEAIGDFNPSAIIKKEKKINDRYTTVFMSFAAFTSLSACFYTYATLFVNYQDQYIYEENEMNVTHVYYNQKLPYNSYIFWDHRKSRWHFGCAVMFQCIPVFNYAFIVVGFDTLYTAIVSYTSCQMKILQGAFGTVRQRCYKRLGLPFVEVLREQDWVNIELNMELVKIIKALQVIFIMCEKLENMFTFIILGQVQVSLLVFCTCLYLISSISFELVLVESIYMIAIELQLWLYCYYGNKVTVRSEDIPLAIYAGDWFSTDTTFKRNMLLTMTRMQRPIYLTIGKFSPLTLATFVTIGRASYSFFAVLTNSN